MTALMAFVGGFVHYLVIFIVLVATALVGIFAGKKWSDHSTAKKAAETAATAAADGADGAGAQA